MVNNIESTVISSRVRLARNLADQPFPNRLTDVRAARQIVRSVFEAASSVRNFRLSWMDVITGTVAQSLIDDHLISSELAANKRCGAVLIADEAEDAASGSRYSVVTEGEDGAPKGKFSVMINEEDHLREQYIVKGLNLPHAYLKISAVDDELSKRLRFAFDAQLGYLTACPTNLGTGLRASVMLFLPGLTRRKKMNKLIRTISGLGHTVRGVYGEGSAAEGYMYQVSNEVTLGVSEDYILSEVQRTVLEIVNLEAYARKELASGRQSDVKDACCRACGILRTCEKVSFREFLRLVSDVKLGIALGWLETDEFSAVDDFIASVRPSNLDVLLDESLEPFERDAFRAQKCREFFRRVGRTEP